MKYASFAIDPIFQLFNSNLQIGQLSKIIIPIGISYFTPAGNWLLNQCQNGMGEISEKSFLNFLFIYYFLP